jgi:hypothetical protein
MLTGLVLGAVVPLRSGETVHGKTSIARQQVFTQDVPRGSSRPIRQFASEFEVQW